MMQLHHPRHASLWELIRPSLDGVGLAHDGWHVQRVYGWAVRLARPAGADPDLAGAAALVHDLVQVPKESEDRAEGGKRSALAGREVLARAGYQQAEIEVVAEAVRTSSWSAGLAPTNREGAVLQDADRLDAMGAIGIARNFACAQEMAGRGTPGRFYHPDDPAAAADRPLDDRRNAADHYRAKLLKLAAGMHTEQARAEARRRHAFMLAFLDELVSEVG